MLPTEKISRKGAKVKQSDKMGLQPWSAASLLSSIALAKADARPA
jgi:hypothetical protein